MRVPTLHGRHGMRNNVTDWFDRDDLSLGPDCVGSLWSTADGRLFCIDKVQVKDDDFLVKVSWVCSGREQWFNRATFPVSECR